MELNINTKWIKIINGLPLVDHNHTQPQFTINELLAWAVLCQLTKGDKPTYRLIIARVLGESTRTVTRRLSVLKTLGLIDYHNYNNIGSYTIGIDARYDFGKFNARYEEIRRGYNIDNIFKKMGVKFSWNNKGVSK